MSTDEEVVELLTALAEGWPILIVPAAMVLGFVAIYLWACWLEEQDYKTNRRYLEEIRKREEQQRSLPWRRLGHGRREVQRSIRPSRVRFR